MSVPVPGWETIEIYSVQHVIVFRRRHMHHNALFSIEILTFDGIRNFEATGKNVTNYGLSPWYGSVCHPTVRAVAS